MRFLLFLAATTATGFAAPPHYTVIPFGESLFQFDDSYGKAINAAGQIVGTRSSNSGDGDNAPTDAFSYASTPPHSVATIAGLFSGGNTEPSGINAHGQTVGVSRRGYEHFGRAFLNSNGTTVDLGSLDSDPASSSSASAINDAGQIVGRSEFGSGQATHAFLYSGGVMTDLGGYAATGINNLGQVIGDGSSGGFLYVNGVTSFIGGSPVDINDLGQVVGSIGAKNNSVSHASLYTGGKTTDLGTLGGANSFATAINNHGDIVGTSDFKKSRFGHAFLYAGRKMNDLNDLIPSASRWIVISARDIADNGLIVGSGQSKNDFRNHALLLAPVPTLKILGGETRTTHRSKITIRGKAGYAAYVSYMRKKRGHSTHGTAKAWRITLQLLPGRNTISVIARGPAGNTTIKKITVIRS